MGSIEILRMHCKDLWNDVLNRHPKDYDDAGHEDAVKSCGIQHADEETSQWFQNVAIVKNTVVHL